jgi:nucleoside-diphosphate-sugar epimerase
MSPAPQRILITGGTGFVGANLVRALTAAGQRPHLLVRPDAKRWRLSGLEHKVHFHGADLLDLPYVRWTVDACRPEIIYHLAGYGVLPSQKDRAGIFAGNVLATANLLAALEDHDYHCLVQAGSSAEYGSKEGPLLEKDPIQPSTDYGVAKACATLLCQAERHKGRRVATIRVFTAFGPWEALPRLVPYVMQCCRARQAPEVSSGEQQRDFVFVDDVVALLMSAAAHPGAAGQILHAATGTLTSVRQVVETIVAISGAKTAPRFGALPRRMGEPDRWAASIEQTAALTGWRPRFDLAAGLRQTWDWHQGQRRAA